MKPRGVFITGTDTGVGKTWVSRLLIDNAPQTMIATYMKPVQTGCILSKDGRLLAPDFAFVAEGRMMPTAHYQDHAPCRFRRACSPHLASRVERRPIRIASILQAYRAVSDRADVVVVEGAGGIMTPLSATTTMLGLMSALRLPVVVVTRPGLGTLNHTRLTLDRIKSAGLVLAGVAINHADDDADDYIVRENRRFIAGLARPALVAIVGFGQSGGAKIKEFCNAVISRL